MPRKLQPCGTHAAYVRHRRNQEECDICKEAERERKAKARAAKKLADASVSLKEPEPGKSVGVEAKYHEQADPVIITVPSGADPLESAKWRLAKVRGAMLLSTPRDMAALAKREEEIVALIQELEGSKVEKKVSALDQLAAKRAQRLANAAG
ncbi:hypothetical protein [Rothia nasimurium]|uniref:hypothetical protein n=1 Tax=Rothia nasimurium TaxID=85336 RepID=UPI003BA0D870